MVRVLASYLCGPGSIQGPGILCGLSVLLVFSGYSGFSSLLKNQHLQIPIRSGIRGATGLSVEKLFSVTLDKQSRFMHSYDCDSEKLCLRKICTCSTQKPNSVINTYISTENFLDEWNFMQLALGSPMFLVEMFLIEI